MKHNRLIEWLLTRYHFTNSDIYQVLKAGITLGIVALGVSRLLGNQRETKILALIVGLISAAFFSAHCRFPRKMFPAALTVTGPSHPLPPFHTVCTAAKKLDDNQESASWERSNQIDK